MAIDRLSALLQRFSVSASMFHAGALCGINDLPLIEDTGQLHLIRRGPLEVVHGGRARRKINQPSLLLYPRPKPHRFITDAKRGADMACANIQFSAAAINPLAKALPEVVIVPLAALTGAQAILDVLFEEAFTVRCGRQRVVDRLFEVVLIQVLRHLMDSGEVDQGLLAGMGHPQLARALVAIHESPERAWTLDTLATHAGMSRSHFAANFTSTVGTAPGEYLARYRICVAQNLLRGGQALKTVADAVGYGSTAALSRAFSAICGESPREWKARQVA